MKTLILSAIVLASIAGCAGAQTKIDSIQGKINCFLDLAQPYANYLTEEDIHNVIKGEDFTSVLEVAGALPAEIQHVKEGIAACKALK